MVPSPAVEALRERFGKYHVIGKIAQGGMAEVYKVKTVGIAGFEKVQALKRILPNQAREARFIRSFVDEARIAVELTHRNIVQVFDFGKADGELFLAMELIEGKDLRTAMGEGVARERLPPTAVAAYIISEVAAGLDYAHRKTDGYGGSLGIVHCDVSPSNVMLSTDGYVKILDFGIARASFASALERRRLRGKPRYMAPEQTLGEPATFAADVFALGIIAWELFTGLPLYRGADLKSTLEAVRRTTPPRIEQLQPSVPREICDAIATALAREQGDRGTAADLGAACARLAMLAGAGALAQWLDTVGGTVAPRAAGQPWHGDDASLDIGPPDEAAPSALATPAQRASTTAIELVFARPSTMTIDPPRRPSTTIGSDWRVPTRVSDPHIAEGTPAFLPERASVTRLEVPRFEDREPDREREPEPQPEPDDATQFGLVELGAGDEVAELALDEALAAAREDEEQAPPAAEPTIRMAPARLTPMPVATPTAVEAIDDAISASPVSAAAERRRAVIVAAVLEGAAPAVLRPIARSLGELAYQRGGVLAGADDEGLVVAFGLEIAGEDDVAIAMGWALDASALARDSGEGIALRVGARTNVATTGGTVPADAADEARSLAREATPERPRFVGLTGRVTSGLYALREVATPRRPVARRSKVIEVVGPRTFDERDQARLARRGKLVGRVAQLGQLDGWLARAIETDRRLAVLITGAAGTGKSRLVAELVARHPEARAVTVAATPASRFAPFAVVIDVYQAALGVPPARGRGARQQVVDRLVHLTVKAGIRPERARAIASDLARAMELRDGAAVGAPEVADLRPRVSAGLAAFRAAVSDRTRPTLTVIEDVHHADNPSLEVLRHILAVPAALPELLVLTARPEGTGQSQAPAAAFHFGPAVDAVITVLDLVGAELRALIVDRLGAAATPSNVAAVIARGGGNPLFVEELAAAVREAGADSHAVPASARDVMAARVDRLSPTAKLALRFAVVLGGAARVRLIEELLDRTASPSGDATSVGQVHAGGESALGDEVAELEAAGLLAASTGADPSEGTLALACGLVGEVVYEALPLRAQREAHARVGRLLASRFFAGRDEPPAVIAEHLERAGEAAGAAAFWLRAGRLALGASDADAAIACFTRCLALERELGGEPPTATSRTRRREALAGREEAHRVQGDFAADPGDLDELQRLCLGDPAWLADVALRRAQRLLRLGDHPGALAATVVAEEQARTARDDRRRGEALRLRGEVLERRGGFDEALALIDQACERFAAVGAASEEMSAMVARGRIHLLRAHYEAAHAAYAPVRARIASTGDVGLERIALGYVAITEVCLGNFEAAMASAQRALELCRRAGDRAREGDVQRVRGTILVEVGLADTAAEHFADALDILGRTSSRWSRADCLIHAGACEARRGHAGGLALLDEALGEARRLDARYLEASARVARAGVRLDRGDLAAAVDDAATGAAVARAAGLVGYEIQGLATQAVALARGGTAADAAPLAVRAFELLQAQRHLEGSEEDVYSACAEVLDAAGDRERARQAEQAGRVVFARKLAGLRDPAWVAAFRARRR